jgi:glycosyltransferase involved in cell wall biosynthesis
MKGQLPAIAFGFTPETFSVYSGMWPLANALQEVPLHFIPTWERVQKNSWTLGNALRQAGIRHYGSAWNALVPWWSEARLLRELPKSETPYLLHFIWGEFAAPKSVKPYHRRGARTVVNVHCSARRWDSVWLRPDGFANADQVILTSESQRPFVARHVPAERISLIPHGVVSDYFTPAALRRAETGKLRLFMLGNTERDHAFAAQVARRLPADRFEWRIRTHCREKSFYQGIDCVTLLPHLTDEEMRAEYQQADVLAMPMLDSAANNVMMESMACGTPVMVNRVGGVPEYVSSDCNFVMGNERNMDEWVDKLLWLEQNRAAVERMRPATRAWAERFDWKLIAGQYRAMYRQVLTASPLRRAFRNKLPLPHSLCSGNRFPIGINSSLTMNLARLYRRFVPSYERNFISGHPWVQSWRNKQLMREGQRLAQAALTARKPDGKIRVAFIVQRPAFWPNHASVYEAMKIDPAFEVSVIAIPKRPPAAREVDLAEYGRLKAFLGEKGIAYFGGYDVENRVWVNLLKFGLPDIVFLPQPYTHTQSFLYHAPYLKHFCSLAILPYSMTMTNLPDSQYYAPVYVDSRFIFIESEAHKALFIAHAPAVAEKLFVTGHPKLDAYRGPVPSNMELWKCPNAKYRIIWAPHFTVTNDRTPHTFSNFFEYYEFFLEYARRHPDIEFVLRPHPELFEHMVATGKKTRAESNAYRDRFNALPNGQVNEGGDIFTMFRQSSALILDSCGFLAEYAPTGKPICYLESTRRQRLNPIGEKLLHAYYAAWNTEEIEEFIQSVVIEGRDERRQERERIVGQTLFSPPDGAAAEIVKCIKQRQRTSGE